MLPMQPIYYIGLRCSQAEDQLLREGRQRPDSCRGLDFRRRGTGFGLGFYGRNASTHSCCSQTGHCSWRHAGGLFAILSIASFTNLRNSDSASTWLGYLPASNRAATRVKICCMERPQAALRPFRSCPASWFRNSDVM